MVEQARAVEVKAAVEKAAAAARVVMAAMRQPVASESKYVHHKRSTARSIALQKVCHARAALQHCCFHRYIVELHSIATHNKTLHGSRVHAFERSKAG